MSAGYEYVDGHRVPRTSVAPEAPAPLPADRRQGSGETLPDSLTGLLHLPDVQVRPDEARCCVVICLPSYLARALAPLAPDPLQVDLCAHLIDGVEQDAADYRRDLMENSR